MGYETSFGNIGSKVKGAANEKTGLLNGGSFNGRSIIASDRNRCESIKIKELATPTAGASNGSHAQKTCKKPLKLRSHGVPELMQPSASYAMGSCGQVCHDSTTSQML